VSRTVAILGAGSGIGRAFAKTLAASGHDLVLAGRRLDDLERTAADCSLRFSVRARVQRFDALAFDDHVAFVERCEEASDGGLEGVVLCYAEMPDEALARADATLCHRMIDTNFSSAVCLLEGFGSRMAGRGRGWICAIGSVAGDRGRPSNHLYGSTKGALAIYLQGLRARMSRSGVKVLTLKPGFVDTGMTYGRPGMFLVASPERVARDAMRGVGRDRAVVYTPGFWRIIMLLIRAIPDRIFNRLNL